MNKKETLYKDGSVKKIGFIDYYLDEWHANNYPKWIRENSVLRNRNMDIAYAWAEKDKPGGLDTDSWCKKYGVEKLSSIEELVEKSDYIIVLSPDNSEHHERFSRIPLTSQKPVYIDKTFSPDLASGVRMFELALKYGTPMFSSSALRFSKELSLYPNKEVNPQVLEYVSTTGPGTFENYGVHQIEMIVSLLGAGAKRIKSLSTEGNKLLVIEYGDGRMASMHQMGQLPFQLSLQLKSGSGKYIAGCTDMFPRLIDEILGFFEEGEPPVSREQTLAVMALLEAGQKAIEYNDKWIKVEAF